MEESGVGGEGHDIDVDSRRADHHHRPPVVPISASPVPVRSVADRHARDRILEIRSRCGWRRGSEIRGVDESRIAKESRAQRPLGPEAVQGMGIGSGPTMQGDDLDDAAKRIRGRDVTVHEPEGLAIMSTDSDFETIFPGHRIADHPTHLEAAHFSAHHSMFDHHLGSAVHDEIDELQMPRIHIGFGSQRRGVDGRHPGIGRSAIHCPHRDVEIESTGSARQVTSGMGNQEVQSLGSVTHSPRQRDTQTPLRSVLDQDPGRTLAHHGRADTEGHRRTAVRWLGIEVPTHESGEFGQIQLAATFRFQIGLPDARQLVLDLREP